MTPEEQALKLAEWLDSHPGTEPPPGLDPEVIEAVYALRPDLAPAPRLSADDILAAVTSGPLAPGWTPEAPVADEEPRGAIVEFPAAKAAPKPVRWRRWALGAGASSLLAVAAAALLAVRVFSGGSEPAEVASSARMQQLETPPATASGEIEEQVVAGLDEEDFVDDFAADLPRERDVATGATGVAATRGSRVTTDAPAREPVAVSTPSAAQVAMEPAYEQPVAMGSSVSPAPAPVTLSKPTARPTPSPAPIVQPTSPGALAAAPPPPTGRTTSSTMRAAEETGPEVADLDDARPEDGRDRRGKSEDSAGAGGATAIGAATADVGAEAEGEPVMETQSESVEIASRPAWNPFGNDRPRDDVAQTEPRRETDRRHGKDATESKSAPASADETVQADGEYRGFAYDNTAELDSLRSQAVPSDLPAGELLARVGTAANESANVYVAEGRYNDAGNALLPTVTLPAPQGSTNAAQAATWFLEGGDVTLARTAAEAGLANTSGNTPERAWLWVLYGDALRQAGDPGGAARAYGEAVMLNDARLGTFDATPASDPATTQPR